MTTLEIILIATLWIIYGVFNASQHDWYKNYSTEEPEQQMFIFFNIIFAPIALLIRIFRGVFYNKLP